MISNVSIQEYARLAHLFRKALDDSSKELKCYPAFISIPKVAVATVPNFYLDSS